MAGGVTIGLMATLIVCALVGPSWYEPPTVPPERQQRVRNDLINAEQAFTRALFAGETFDYHIYDDMVNEWIAMRREIFPLIDRLAPALVANPSLRITEDGVSIAGRCDLAGVSAVVSLDLELFRDERGIVVRASAARCGRLPIPLTLSALRLQRPIACAQGRLWPGSPAARGNLIDGLVISDRAWWNNGGIAYQVRELSLKKGQIDLRVQPLGHHVSSRESDH